MINKIIKPFLYLIPLIVIQLTIIPFISVADISPNLIVVLLTYYTLLFGQMYGMILGFISGFIFDLFSGGFLGASMLSFSVAGFIVGYFYYENKIDTNTSTFLFTIIVFISATIYSFLFSTVANSNTDLNFVYIFVESGFLPGIYTSVFSLPFIIFRSKKGIL